MPIYQENNYDDQQYNTLGKPLAQTPPSNNAPIANDPNNDKRTAFDHKSQLLQAQATVSRLQGQDDNPNVYTGRNGFKYDLVDDSRAGQVRQAMQGYLTASLAGKSPGEAANYASEGVSQLIATGKRQSMIKNLEEDPAGYNQLDIQKYIQSGEIKDLTANMGKWDIKDGYKVNDLTGEAIPVGMSAADQEKYRLESEKNAEEARHNTATEQNDLTRSGFENQRIGNDQARLEFDKSQAAYKQSQDQQKANSDYEDKNTQIQAVAAQGNQTVTMGKDILTDPNFKDYAGTNYSTRVARAGSSGFGDNVAGGMKSKQDQYNHMAAVIGNASLYLDAGSKRIFAKEMEQSGKQFQPVDFEHMTYAQIQDAIHNNEPMIARFTQLAQASAAHQPHPNADQIDYGNTYGSNQQLPRAGVTTAPNGKNYNKLW